MLEYVSIMYPNFQSEAHVTFSGQFHDGTYFYKHKKVCPEKLRKLMKWIQDNLRYLSIDEIYNTKFSLTIIYRFDPK